MQIFNLPMELVLCILEWAYYSATMLPDYRTLSSCSAVCRAWRDPAQKLLFHTVLLTGRSGNGRESVRLFRLTLTSLCPRNEVLASHVRRIDIVVSQAIGSSLEDLVDIVMHCHRLYDVTLRVMGLHALDEATLRKLRAAHVASRPHSIRSLSLLVCGVQSPILYQLLSVWPTIRFLRLGAELVAPPPDEPTEVQLYELVLHRPPPLHILDWLLASSHHTLRIFECHAAPGVEYDPLFATFGHQLISLRLFPHTKRSAALIQHCPNLRELVIAQLSSFLPLGELPPTLEHLSFRSLTSVALIPLHSVISIVDKSPRLHLLSCDVITRENADFSSLQKSCDKRGARLFSGLLPILIFEDPVPLQGFPRGKSVANFPFMNEPDTVDIHYAEKRSTKRTSG